MDNKLKKKLEEIAAKNNKITGDQLYSVYRNQNNKYTNEKLTEITKKYIVPYVSTNGDKLFSQYEVNVNKKQMNPLEALTIMLSNASLVPSIKPQTLQKPQIPVKPIININVESPVLCSTRIDLNTPEIVVSQVKT